MSRSSIALVWLAFASLVVAVLPWTVSSDRLTGSVARQLKREYGLELAVDGRTTLALLPLPRLKLENVRLADANGRLAAEAGSLRIELRPAALALLRLRIAELRVSGGKIALKLDQDGGDPTAGILLAMKNGADESASRIERLVVTDTDLDILHPPGRGRTEIRDVSATLHWPDPAGDLDISASGIWNGETLSVALAGLNPALLVAGQSDAFKAAISTRLGQVSGVGDLSWRAAGPRFSGRLSGATPSLAALTRWTGSGLDLQDFERPLVITGEGTLARDGFEWPRASIELGGERIEGSVAYRLDRERPQVRATLAGDSLDLGWLLPIADPTLADPPHSDYDVRLSASDLRLGPIRLRDAATGILVNGEKLEVSLARATLAGGSVRGRMSASLDGEGRDIKGQVAVEKLRADQFLAEIGAAPSLSGLVAGQVLFDLTGDRKPDVAASLRGRATLTATDGEIAGVVLGELPRRVDETAALTTGAIDRRRTRFGRANVAVEFGRGLAEIVDGTIEGASARTQLRGEISLHGGFATLRTSTTATGGVSEGRPPVVLDLRGSLNRLAVTAAATGNAPTSSAGP